jgi:hypothetical protein
MHMSRYYGGVGSRETPDPILLLFARIGRTLCDQGFGLSSGDAIGADYAFYVGARLSENFANVPQRIFLSRNGFQGRYEDRSKGFIDASRNEAHWQQAMGIAEQARGGFYNLTPGGIALHTRNVFQIMGEQLDEPVRAVYLYATPHPTQDKVSGGTNTAYKIAKQCNIERIYNFAYESVQTKALAWLAVNETRAPYPFNLLELIHSRKTREPFY